MKMNNDRFNGMDDPDATVPTPAGEDPRLLSAVEEYLSAIESGRRPNRQEFVARYPEIARELSECIQGLSFVNAGAAQVAADAGVESGDHIGMAAKPLGDFRLLREIGRGGMGVVYEAMQLSLGRRVAVKVLPLASALDPRHLQRFRNEAHAAAQLHHNNIVPVYAVGHERAVHFYAMQLIEGRSLSDVIRYLRTALGRETRKAGGHSAASETTGPMRPLSHEPLTVAPGSGAKPSPAGSSATAPPMSADLSSLALTPGTRKSAYYREVARLALQAAEALEYAHQQGVVHRDIKPANLLLDGRGKLWISDFGLAQIYADNGLTQTGDILGTFRYMSPEQASGRAVVLDQRTDVYSLGVTIYELLTLEPALAGDSRGELLRQIESDDPKPLRSLDATIPAELETIILKAASKDAAERYASAGAMAEDLRRFLADEPILARPPSTRNRVARWTRRHKAAAAAVFAVLLFTTVASIVATLLIALAHNRTTVALRGEQIQRARADDLRLKAEQQQARAEQNYREARQAVDYFTRVATEQIPKQLSLVPLKRNMLETALDYYQSFSEQQGPVADAGDLVAARKHAALILAEVTGIDHLERLHYSFELLRQPAIQQELGLSAEQVGRAANFSGTRPEPPPEPKFGPQGPVTEPTEHAGKGPIDQEAAQMEQALKTILSAAQFQRIEQISRQLRGVFTFSDPDVVASLSLTRDQKLAIQEVQARFSNFVRHHGHDSSPGLHPAEGKAAVDEVLSLLSIAQVQTWGTLIGSPYNGTGPSLSAWSQFEPPPFGRDHHGPPGDDNHGPHGPHGHGGPPPGDDER